MNGTAESEWEAFALEVLGELGWEHVPGQAIGPGSGERDGWGDLVLRATLHAALRRLNPDVPEVYLLEALEKAFLNPPSNDAITENHRAHGWLVDGYRGITYTDDDGSESTPTIRLLSTDPAENTWRVASQVTVRNAAYHRRFDLVLYCNGLPVSVVELKKAGSATADVASAHAQLQTYVREFPTAFRFAVFTVVSDGLIAKYGTPFTELNHFAPWNVDDDGAVQARDAQSAVDEGPLTGLESTLHGVANQERFLQLLRWYTAFDGGAGGLHKRVAKPHQYFAVTKAFGETVRASRVHGDRKAGVVWHTQGSGKSMEMELFTNRIMRAPELANPTVVVITDRRELDGQLYGAFSVSELLPEEPVQIRRRAELRAELSGRGTGGILFTTLQKFGKTGDERGAGVDHPLLTDRRNVVVIVDEAHRSHYDDLDGYARHLRDALPHATLIAFTGTPISFADRNTRTTFGDYIDVYDLTRAVKDGATVPVYFAPHLVKMALRDDVTQEDLDRVADEVTTGLDDVERAQIQKSVLAVNAVYGHPDRIAELVDHLLEHWEGRRTAMEPLIGAPGKALLVGGTRQICADLYDAIVARRPDWHSDEVDRGRVKVVYSGDASDKGNIARHVRRESQNAAVKERLRDVGDELEIVIVKDMLLTGYDSPPMHTLYLDRPLQGALLMQTLARVNRTFRGKDAGLLVGYAPVADNLQRALTEYSKPDQEGRPLGRDVSEAVALTGDLLAQIDTALAPFEWRRRLHEARRRGHRAAYRSTALAVTNWLRSPETPGNRPGDGEESLADRYRRLSSRLSRAWALCGREEGMAALLPAAQFYEEVRVYMAKFDAEDRRADGRPVPEEVARLLAALIVDSSETGEVLDIYAAAGLPQPALSDLTPEFVRTAQEADNPQLAIEALRTLVLTESRRATGGNVIRERLFSDGVAELMNRYTNSQLTSAQVIAELVKLAREVSVEASRGERFTPSLTRDELMFYDAVTQNESAVREQGDDVLAQIARDLVGIMQRDVRTDWTVRDDVRAKLRSSIKRLLVKHKYPPDRQSGAIALVMEQMEQMAPRYADRAA